MLMSNVHSKYHNEFLKKYMSTNQGKFINQERFVFGKNRNSNLFPTFISISQMESMITGI